MGRHDFDRTRVVEIDPRSLARLIGAGILVFVVVLLASSGTYVVQPGFRGVAVTLGKVSPEFKPEGFGFRQPFITRIVPLTIRQQTRPMPAECYSSDLQQVKMEVHVLYRVPEHSVVKIFQEYAGEPFDSLIAPRVQEALKEVAATQSAEQIVKKREEVKTKALELARRKIGTNFLDVVDVVLYNLALSPELEAAIEMKMVQEQDAEKAKFTQLKAKIEADTAIIRAKGEAEAIEVRGTSLRANPDFIKLQILQNWNGRSPLVVGAGGSGANLLLSLDDLSKHLAPSSNRPVRTTPPPGAPPRNR
ncbi:MAG: prohibitin family protein [Verrucomicrobia bacterium]|nr:prohibitin family protein [Verrucomicrobiota bacterium]